MLCAFACFSSSTGKKAFHRELMFVNIKTLSAALSLTTMFTSELWHFFVFNTIKKGGKEKEKEKVSSFSVPGSFLIESIVARSFRFLLIAIIAVLTTLHRRVHLKHFELLFYIGSLANAKDNLAAALEHRTNCFANKKRDRSLRRRLWLLLGLIFCLLYTTFDMEVE